MFAVFFTGLSSDPNFVYTVKLNVLNISRHCLDGEEPIIKQYLKNCLKNTTYKSQKTRDSLVASLDFFFFFADKSTSTAISGMLGVFISSKPRSFT